MLRRQLFGRALAGATVLAAGTMPLQTFAAAPRGSRGPVFVLVHGAWHASWCWSPVVAALAAQGHVAVAVDLPGHGTDARYPAGYLDQPQNADALATAPSPLGGITLARYRDHVGGIVERLHEAGHAVVLVGHSLGGVTLHAVGEAMPGRIRRLVYLTALGPLALPSAGAYFGLPAFATSKALPLFLGDPSVTGAVRLNARSPSPQFQAAARAAFYADVPDAVATAATQMLTPDEPAAIFGAEPMVTDRRSGSVPRTYIRCTDDQALPLATQDLFIAEADARLPRNRTRTVSLAAGHSPFLSQPARLAEVLAAQAA